MSRVRSAPDVVLAAPRRRWPWAAAPTSTPDASGAATTGVTSAAREVADGTGVWDASTLHEISVEVDEDAYAAMIDDLPGDRREGVDRGDRDDRRRDLRARRAAAQGQLVAARRRATTPSPTDLPWLIRLDKFVDGQAIDGWTELVVRSNSSETALNEALALDLLAEAGLASEHAVASSFSVNGADARLRLVVQNLDERVGGGELLHATACSTRPRPAATGRYRGDDPDAYTDVFDQETGDDDLTPLIDFLDFINNSTDEEFAAELPEHLDVQAFARYLAFEEVVDNFDDIDGPGNNSYLRYDAETGGFTVVAWDHNLAFGALARRWRLPGRRVPRGRRAARGDADRPADRPAERHADRHARAGCRAGCPRGAPEGGPGGHGRRVQRPRRALHRGRGVGRPRRAGEGRPDRGALRQRLRRGGPRPVGRRAHRAGRRPRRRRRRSRRRPTRSARRSLVECEAPRRARPRSHLNHRRSVS